MLILGFLLTLIQTIHKISDFEKGLFSLRKPEGKFYLHKIFSFKNVLIKNSFVIWNLFIGLYEVDIGLSSNQNESLMAFGNIDSDR